MPPVEVAKSMPTRLTEAAAAVTAADKALKTALQQRREVIFQAIDHEGMSHQAVAKLIGVAKGRISAILAAPDQDEDD